MPMQDIKNADPELPQNIRRHVLLATLEAWRSPAAAASSNRVTSAIGIVVADSDGCAYPMLPPGDRLSPAEFKAVEKVVKDRGEKFVIAISVPVANHATVLVGEGSYFRDVRRYKVVRSDGAWRVEAVENLEHHP